MANVSIPTSNRFKNLSGKTFGKLTVVEFGGVVKKRSMWRCKCVCGKEKTVYGYDLSSGHTQSCGCLGFQRRRESTTKHGMSHVKSAEYAAWKACWSRCANKNDNKYNSYGGRGIKVCERWREFSNFLADVGERPSPLHSLDRYPNNDGDYEPGNCRWATNKEQADNRRTSILVRIGDEEMSIMSWSTRCGIPYQTLYRRLVVNKWEPHKAIETRVRYSHYTWETRLSRITSLASLLKR